MFEGFSQATGDFLWGLALNNNRTWFLEHKAEYEAHLNQPFRALAEDTLALARQRWPSLDLQPHVARIYRDARRLFGRGPYKDHLWFSLQPGTRRAQGPMFWFELGGTDYSYGMGFWDATPDQAAALRARIDADPASFEAMVRDLEARGPYRMWGQEYKRPKGDLGPRINPWYNRRRVSAGYERGFGGDLYSPGLPRILIDAFDGLMPLYTFLLSTR